MLPSWQECMQCMCLKTSLGILACFLFTLHLNWSRRWEKNPFLFCSLLAFCLHGVAGLAPAAAEQTLLLHIAVGIFDLWKKIAVPPPAGSQFTDISSMGDTTPFSFPLSPDHQQKLQLPFLTALASHLTLFLPLGKLSNYFAIALCLWSPQIPEVPQIRGADMQLNLK